MEKTQNNVTSAQGASDKKNEKSEKQLKHDNEDPILERLFSQDQITIGAETCIPDNGC